MIDILILFLLLTMLCWDLPTDSPAALLIKPLRRPVQFLGLWHSWAMFSPEPITVHHQLSAILHFCDGSSQHWSPLRAGSAGLRTKLIYARFWKYEHSVMQPDSVPLQNELCRFLAEQAASNGQSVRAVTLFRELRRINSSNCSEVYDPLQQEQLAHWKAPRQAAAAINGEHPQ